MFIYQKYIFNARPKGFKTELIQICKSCNVKGKAKKCFIDNNLRTILECVASKTNCDTLLSQFKAHPYISKMDMNIEEKQLKNDELDEQILNFLNSPIVISETPVYLRRFNLKNYKHPTSDDEHHTEGPVPVFQSKNLKDQAKEDLVLTGKKLLQLSQYFPNEVLQKSGRKLSQSFSYIDEEETVQIICRKIGEEFHKVECFLYPSEPPTTVLPFIMNKYQIKDFKEILLFDEDGDMLNNESQVSKSHTYYFGFDSEISKFMSENKVISELLKEFKKFDYFICAIAMNNLTLEKFARYAKYHKLDGVIETMKLPACSRYDFLCQIEELLLKRIN